MCPAESGVTRSQSRRFLRFQESLLNHSSFCANVNNRNKKNNNLMIFENSAFGQVRSIP